ncbi:MAG: hypothetical protein ABR582_04020 [Gemmatimonadaceae bacterium]
MAWSEPSGAHAKPRRFSWHIGPSGTPDIVAELHDKIDRVLFPLTGIASLLTVLHDGTSLEDTPVKATCRIEGEFYSIPAKSFKRGAQMLAVRHPGVTVALGRLLLANQALWRRNQVST